MKVRILFFLCIISILFSTVSKGEDRLKRRMSLTEVFDAMSNHEGYTFKLSDVIIELDPNTNDSLFFEWTLEVVGDDSTMWQDVVIEGYDFSHLRQMTFKRCEFKGWIPWRKIKFKTLVFAHCQFSDGTFNLDSCEFNHLEFFKCVNENGWWAITNNHYNNEISFRHCEAKGYVQINGNSFESPGGPEQLEAWGSSDPDYMYTQINIEDSKFNKLQILGGEFKPGEEGLNVIGIHIENSQFEGLNIKKIEIGSISLENSTVTKSLAVDSVKVLQTWQLFNLDFPLDNTNMSWANIAGQKMCFSTYQGAQRYFGKSDEELANIYYYNELLSIYQKLFHLYRNRGDLVSANGCYIELKDLETRRLNYLYRTEGGMKNYFNWRLNHFLKIFCEYGTSPVRSLIISMYVVLIFAFFYFFFYSDWDRINRSFLIAKSKRLLTYFQSEQKMEDFYTEEHKDELESYESFKAQIQDSTGKIPFFMNFFMKPLYRLSLIRYKVISWLYRRTEILSGKWEDLTSGRKIVVGSVVGISLTGYLVYLIFVRSLNSLFLSINTFSTLGFGDIPVKGISRYMAILEGFLGWFLLSIFSVSLISQILQN